MKHTIIKHFSVCVWLCTLGAAAGVIALPFARPHLAFGQVINPDVRITLPARDQTVRSTVAIQGTAKSSVFSRYEVAYAQESDATNWIVLGGGVQSVENGQLAVWNTRPLADGKYSLRLQVFGTDGSLNETIALNISLANAAAAPSPESGTVITDVAQSPVAVTDVQSARDTLQVIGGTIGELPGAFVRGGRYALMALAALGVYTLIKRLVLFALPRLFKRRVNYGR